MANAFDQFDSALGGNAFDQFDDGAKPKPFGKDANADFLRAELRNADPFTRNLAGVGVAASDAWEGLKQWFGKGDKDRIAANKVIAEEAPVAALAGDVAMTAIPFMAVPGATVKTAAKIGAGMGALRPSDSEGLGIVADKAKSIVTEAALAGGGQKIANWVGGKLAAKEADLAVDSIRNAERDATVKAAQEAGLSVQPSAVNPSWWNTLRESVGGKAQSAQAISNKNAPVIDKMIRKELYLPDDVPLTSDLMEQARGKAYAVGYKPIADVPAINWDIPFDEAVKALSPRGAGGAVPSAAQKEIDDLIVALTSRGQWTGAQLVRDIRELRSQAKTNFKAYNSPGAQDLAKVQDKAAELMEGLAERNLRDADPNAIQLFREARQYIAKTHDVEDAIIEGSGSVDARKFGAKFQAQKPLTGELRTLGAFANNYKSAVQPAAKVQGVGVSALNPALGAILGTASITSGQDPMTSAAAAAAPFLLRGAARQHMMSRGAQRNALRDIYELGLAERTARRMLPYTPAGFTMAGSEAFLE